MRPFRLAVLRLAGRLNALLASDATMDNVKRAAKTIAQTEVYPELAELRRVLEDPRKPWHKRAAAVFKDIPDLVQSFVTLPKNIAFAKVLSKAAVLLADLRDESLEKDGPRKRSGYYYLLRA